MHFVIKNAIGVAASLALLAAAVLFAFGALTFYSAHRTITVWRDQLPAAIQSTIERQIANATATVDQRLEKTQVALVSLIRTDLLPRLDTQAARLNETVENVRLDANHHVSKATGVLAESKEEIARVTVPLAALLTETGTRLPAYDQRAQQLLDSINLTIQHTDARIQELKPAIRNVNRLTGDASVVTRTAVKTKRAWYSPVRWIFGR